MSLLDRFRQRLNDASERSLLRALRPIERRDGPFVIRDGKRLLCLASNDYLGLGGRDDLAREFLARIEASDNATEYGFGGASSRLLVGDTTAHEALESDLAALHGHGREALCFASGYHANIGILPTMCGRGDLILADKRCHASMIDGFRLSRATLLRYEHNDLDHLQRLLEERAGGHEAVFIATESIFSMDGDAADLSRLVELKRRHEAWLYVDEAHAVGVCGPSGLGLAESLGLVDAIDVLVGTFGKALASQGAYAVVDPVVKQYLVNAARPLIFTTAPPPIVVSWTRFVLERMTSMAAEREHARGLADRLRDTIREIGLTTGGVGPIVPVVLGTNDAALAAASRLEESGFLAPAIRPPTVPEGTARLRLSLTADMTWEMLDGLPRVLRDGMEDAA